MAVVNNPSALVTAIETSNEANCISVAPQSLTAPIAETHKIFIRCAVGQILAEPVFAPKEASVLRLARVSGYALRSSDLAEPSEHWLGIAGSATPTSPYLDALEPYECVQLVAGALLPAHSDCLVTEDQVDGRLGKIRLRLPIAAQSPFSALTERLMIPESIVFTEGHRLINSDLAVLASLGIYEVCIRRVLRVGYLFVNHSPNLEFDAFAANESHRLNLYSTLAQLNVEIVDLGTVHRASAERITTLSEVCDVVIAIGAIETDSIFLSSNKCRIHVHAEPPLYAQCMRLNASVFVTLPKLPIQAMFTLRRVVIPLIEYLRGEKHTLPFKYQPYVPV